VPDSVSVATGKPAVEIVKAPAVPTANDVFAALVIEGLVSDGVASTVKLNVCVAVGPMPFEALIVIV
jgi:hypothetical protein